MSERHACWLIGLGRSTLRYRPHPAGRNPILLERLRDLARLWPRFGYRRLHALLRREGNRVNHKRVYSLYREEGLMLRRKRRRKWVRSGAGPKNLPARPNERWSLDFVSDAAANGQTIRVLAVVDDYTRECLALEVDTSLPGTRVARTLNQIVEQRGRPTGIVLDNGPELRGRALQSWSENERVPLLFIDPGKPVQNAFIESFNGRLRDECLNANWFLNTSDARRRIQAWRQQYNQSRPHSSLDYLTPAEFAARAITTPRLSSYSLRLRKRASANGRNPSRVRDLSIAALARALD